MVVPHTTGPVFAAGLAILAMRTVLAIAAVALTGAGWAALMSVLAAGAAA